MLTGVTACGGNTEQAASIATQAPAAVTQAPETQRADTPSEEPTAEEPAAESEPAPEPLEDPELVNMVLWALASPPSNEALALVNEKINEITIPEINVEVNLQMWDTGTYVGTIATTVAAGEDIDLKCTFPAGAGNYTPMANQGMLLPLDSLLADYGQDILNLIPEDWWDATTRNGEIMSVPLYANKAVDQNVLFVKEWFDETGFNIDDIKSFDDLYPVLQAFKQNHPDKIAVSGDTKTLDFTYPGFELISGNYFDSLGDSTAFAAIVEFTPEGETDYKVVNRYETEEFNTMRKNLQQWYNEGLVDRDAITNDGVGFILSVKDNVFMAASCVSPVTQSTRNLQCLRDVYCVKLSSGVLSTASLSQMTWGLPVTCDVPESAMKLLNMLYTDERLVNLIDHGIEGVHYVINADGQMDFPEGVSADTSKYYPGCSSYVTNTFLRKTWVGTSQEDIDAELESTLNAVPSPLLGFSFDTTNVADTYQVLSTLCRDEYGPALYTGAATDEYYDELITKMYEAGLQAYLDEMQAQVDAWVAANK
jgi:putative aldouronate transport system substrate-binding protein